MSEMNTDELNQLVRAFSRGESLQSSIKKKTKTKTKTNIRNE